MNTPSVRIFFDARLAVRGLGISSAASRLLAAFDDPAIELRNNAARSGWTRRGLAETVALSGGLDISPRADPRTWHRDVVHYYGNTAPQWCDRRTVVTVHDLMCVHRSGHRSGLFKALLVPGLRRARTVSVVAISGQTADDLASLLPHLRGRIRVISHGYRPGRYSDFERQHIMMFGGQGDPRKRISLGLAAYASYVELAGSRALPLVVAGRAGFDAGASGLSSRHGRVNLRPDPSAAEVEHLLAAAACVIYPSAEEGFGLPIVEAGEVGTRVVYDKTARIPKEPLGTHTIAVDGSDAKAWGNAIRDAVAQGPAPDALSHLPTWHDTATTYGELYREVAGSS